MASTIQDHIDLIDTQVITMPGQQAPPTQAAPAPKSSRTVSERQLRAWMNEALRQVLEASSLSLGEGPRERLLTAARARLGAVRVDAAERDRLRDQVEDLQRRLAASQASHDVALVRDQLRVAHERLSASESERLRLNRILRERFTAGSALVEAVLAIDQASFGGRHGTEAHAAATDVADRFFADEAAARSTAAAVAAEFERLTARMAEIEHERDAAVADAAVQVETAEMQQGELARIHAAAAIGCLDAMRFGPAPLHRLAGDDAGLRQLALGLAAPTPDALQPAWWWLGNHGRTAVWQDAAGRVHQASERAGRWWHAVIAEAGTVVGPAQARRDGDAVRIAWADSACWVVSDASWRLAPSEPGQVVAMSGPDARISDGKR